MKILIDKFDMFGNTKYYGRLIMKKKRAKSRPAKKISKKRSTKYNSGFLPYLVSGLVTLVILFLFINYYNATRNPNVLGISSVLARDDESLSLEDNHKGPQGEIPMGRDGNSGQSGQFNQEKQAEPGHAMTADVSGRKPQGEPPHMNISGTPVPPRTRDQKMEIHREEENDDLDFHSATDSSGFIMRHRGVEADADGVLSHDPEATSSNQLLLTTPSGNKKILVLPDEAIQKVLEHNKLTQIFDENGASVSADLAKIKLTVKGDQAVFEVKGIKKEKFLGFIPVNLHKTADISAETGDVTTRSDSFFGGVMDLLSF